MIIEYVRVDVNGKPGAVLDTVTLAEDGTVERATTGKARDLIAGLVLQFGPERAMEILRDWGNGYVLTREVTAE